MPVLKNPKHELFAQARFKGSTAIAAYVKAGYKPNDGHASRLAGNGRITARVAELQREAARKVVASVSFEAKDLFRRLEAQIERAETAGQHKVAMDGRTFMLECFGYKDSPTLTHEQVRGTPLAPEQAETAAEEKAERNVIHLADSMRAIRKLRMGG